MTNFYNAENRLNEVRLPSGVAVTNSYDFAGRLTNRSSTIGETNQFEYNNNDAVTKMTETSASTARGLRATVASTKCGRGNMIRAFEVLILDATPVK